MLAEGKNLVSIRAILTDASVMSKVTAVVQRPGSDQAYAGSVAKDAATATNPSARPGRDAYVVAEHPGDATDAQTRANHEIARQFFTSVDVNCVVQGWLKPGSSELWQVIEGQDVYSPSTFTEPDGKMPLFVKQTTFMQDANSGTRTSIDLCLKQGLSSFDDPGDLTPLPTAAGQSGAQPSYNLGA